MLFMLFGRIMASVVLPLPTLFLDIIIAPVEFYWWLKTAPLRLPAVFGRIPVSTAIIKLLSKAYWSVPSGEIVALV